MTRTLKLSLICAMFPTLVWTSSEEIFVEGASPTSAFKTQALKATHINFLWSRLLLSKGQPQKHWLYFLFWLSLTSLSSYSYSWEQMTIDELRAAKKRSHSVEFLGCASWAATRQIMHCSIKKALCAALKTESLFTLVSNKS